MAFHRSKILIVGAGPAGYTAAIYAARANLEPILVTGLVPGGQLTITTDVENYPGFGRGVQGPQLMEEMRQQAEYVGTRIVYDTITSVRLADRPVELIGDSGDRYVGDTLVIATGAQARWLGLDSEKAYSGYGVSACATCDGFFFRGKEVFVIGGGNSAVEEALYLTNHASKVTLVHRRNRLRAEPILQDRLFAHPKIEVIWDHLVDEIVGQEEPVRSVSTVLLRHAGSGVTRTLPTEGVFVAIGHDPATALFADQIERDAQGYIVVGAWSTSTSVPHVWAAGDCAESKFRQAVVAAGMGCMAALEAEKFLAEHSGAPDAQEAERAKPDMIGAW